MNEKVAVLHGNYLQRGGGEVVADAIASALDAPLFYGFGDDSVQPNDDLERIQIFDPGSRVERIAEENHHVRDIYFMWAGQHLSELHDYDVIIQSGNEFGWFVPKDDQVIIKYVHSTPRGPFDLFHLNGESWKYRAYSTAARVLYQHTTAYPDAHLANSELVARRCHRYWDVNADVLYPPVDVDSYGPENFTRERESTYLTFSRLFRHKRTREIVEAFEELDATLIVGGDGPERETLEEIAPANVEIRGYLDEPEKRSLLAECEAFLFNARNEDFGIVPVEAFASGTPVIGIDDGFTKYQIADGQNGIVFENSDPCDIAAAVRRFEAEGIEASSEQLQTFAERFSTSRFRRTLLSVIADVQEDAAIENLGEAVDWRQDSIPSAGVEAVPDGGDDAEVK